VCVKPQVVASVAEQISDKVTAKQLVISVAASVHTSELENSKARWARECRSCAPCPTLPACSAKA